MTHTDEPVSIESLFDTQCYDSIEILMNAENLTTSMRVQKEPPIQLCELEPKKFSLEIPKRSCAIGHHMMVWFQVKPPGLEAFEFSLTAKVESMDDDLEGVTKVNLVPIQFEEKDWGRFQEVFLSRQNEIDDFMKSARGF